MLHVWPPFETSVESRILTHGQYQFSSQLYKSGVITTLRLLFARQAKGKRKLVLREFFDSYATRASESAETHFNSSGVRTFQTSIAVCHFPSVFFMTVV